MQILEKQLEKSERDAVSKVSSAKKKVAALDKLVVNTVKRAAKMLCEEKEKSKKKSKMQDERTDKLLEDQNIRKDKENEKDKAAALLVHNSLSNQIHTLTSNTLANCLPNDNVCQEGDNKLVRESLERVLHTLQKSRTKSQAIQCGCSRLDAYDNGESLSEVDALFHTGVIDEVTEAVFPKVISIITHVLWFFKYIILNSILLSST